jgi:hypothetical protein
VHGAGPGQEQLPDPLRTRLRSWHLSILPKTESLYKIQGGSYRMASCQVARGAVRAGCPTSGSATEQFGQRLQSCVDKLAASSDTSVIVGFTFDQKDLFHG